MELSEAKEIMNELKNRAEEFNNLYSPDATEFTAKLIPTIDTILKALDNSISKDKLRKLLNTIETDEEIAMSNEDEKIVNELQYLKGKLQELLGEE